MQRMMTGLTVCFTILMIAGSCYVGSYVYFRETRAFTAQLKGNGDIAAVEKDGRLSTAYAPLITLDLKLTGTTVRFGKPSLGFTLYE